MFRYGIVTGRCERDPSADLRGALAPTKVKHMAAVTDPKEIGGLLRAIDGYQGTWVVRCALQLLPLVFVRPGELRHAEWKEFSFEDCEWRIPAEKMKMRQAHIVPLSRQALEVLREIQQLTGRGQYVFPNLRHTDKPVSENTLNGALRRLGYTKEKMTPHGFRSMASTRLHEQGWGSALIKRQLGHCEQNTVKAAYNHAEHLPERREMLQKWADYLDSLKNK